MPKTKTETSLSVIKPELIAEGEPQVINVDLQPFNKAKEVVGLTLTELNKYLVISEKEVLDGAMATLKIASKVEKAIENKRKDLVKPFNDGATAINAHAKEITEGLPKAIADVKSAALKYQKDEEEKALELKKQARIKQLTDMGFTLNEETGAYRLEGVDSVFIKDVHLQGTDGMWSDLMSRVSDAIQEAEAKKNEALKEEDPDLYDLMGYDEPTAETAPVLPAPSTSFFTPTKLTGAAKIWKFEVTDASQVPKEYLIVNQVLIREAINAGTREIPGVRIYQEDQLRIR